MNGRENDGGKHEGSGAGDQCAAMDRMFHGANGVVW
jgi:hypothetical protein